MIRAAAILLILIVAGCGKQGPPLPPLHLVPDAVTEVTARRSANDVRFVFTLPRQNVSGRGEVNLGRVDVYGATVAFGAVSPTNRELLSPRHLVATIQVRPPVPEAAPTTPGAAKPEDPRPVAGDRVTVVETLDAAKLQPVFTTMAPPAPVTATAAAKAAEQPVPKVPTRVYVIRGVARDGRPGQPTGRIELPLIDPPAPPTGVAAKFTAAGVTLAWTPPPTEPTAPVAFNIYGADATMPLNPRPLMDTTFDRAGIEFGKEECFIVRSLRPAGALHVESEPSAPACVTPTDVFAPSEPKGLSAVAGTGVISLIWDANPETDLAGYVVLRGEVPGDKLQALTPTPIKETTFRDTTVKPGVRYVYAIVAVDQAKNASGQSMRVEETAR